ncbi:hypothetical protein GGR96_002716 [Thalassospira tepidiphila]|uniref:Uncharacterized protein n=2 Tax=Thalassospira tepidiphila TaxID=393657 RepID=A0A853KVP3_9PROT|nr:hypothetical protein [Thalassospira tepidiphila]OAZ08405.1 hypothetical protein TH4_17310 [Thalassospira tepidiphila MCCC 1A03514]
MRSGVQLELDFPKGDAAFTYIKPQVVPIVSLSCDPGYSVIKVTFVRMNTQTGRCQNCPIIVRLPSCSKMTSKMTNKLAIQEARKQLQEFAKNASNDY